MIEKDKSITNDILLDVIKIQTEIAQQGLDLSGIMDLVTLRAQEITHADGASVELIEKDELVYSAVSGIVNRFLGLRLKVANSLSGLCIDGKRALISYDTETDDRVNREACREIGLNSMIVLPLISGGKVVGVLKVLSAKPNYFDEEHIKILELMSGLIAAAMLHAIQNGESELIYKATHDSLTGISNRAFFYDRLRSKLKNGIKTDESFGVLAVDMDGLKEMNDTLGHRVGDAALKELARRMKEVLRETDVVSRLGGDEFGAIVSLVRDREDLLELLKRIQMNIDQPFVFEERIIPLRASLGYALFSEDGIGLDVLIEKADQSMYNAKRARKGINNIR